MIVDTLIPLIIEEDEMDPSTESKVSSNIGQVNDVLDIILDCSIALLFSLSRPSWTQQSSWNDIDIHQLCRCRFVSSLSFSLSFTSSLLPSADDSCRCVTRLSAPPSQINNKHSLTSPMLSGTVRLDRCEQRKEFDRHER